MPREPSSQFGRRAIVNTEAVLVTIGKIYSERWPSCPAAGGLIRDFPVGLLSPIAVSDCLQRCHDRVRYGARRHAYKI